MTKANPTLLLNKTAAAQTNGIYGMTNSSYRWGISLGDANAESGSNNGSFFSITAFNDAGGSIFTPISIARYDGLVFLAGDPTQPLHAATKQYVDGHASSTPFAAMAYNGIQLNGGMEVNQFRAAGVGVALANSTAFVLDCWRCASSGVATISAAQNTGAFPGGFQNCLQMVPTVGTSSPGTGDYNIAYQRIEGLAVRNLQWGSASASPVTLSFWVAAGRPGLNSGLITNGITNSRSYAFTYTITIPGDTTGTWVKDNTGGFQVSFCMMGGGTALIAPNVWGSTTGVVGAIGQTNNCQTGGDQMLITGVTLFAGSVGPSAQQSVFVARPYHLESARCKRYYQQLGGVLFAGYQGGSGAFYGDFSFLEMRASPSVSAANMAYSNASTVALNVAYPYHMRLQAVMTATGYGFAYGDYSLDATI
jgi:hypothetical protein